MNRYRVIQAKIDLNQKSEFFKPTPSSDIESLFWEYTRNVYLWLNQSAGCKQGCTLWKILCSVLVCNRFESV